MKKNMLLSVIAVTLICALAGAGTMAWFTSRAVSEENVFTAGTLILGGKPGVQARSGDGDGNGEGWVREEFAAINGLNLEPGKTISLDPVELKNMGTLPLRIMRLWASNPLPETKELAAALDVTVRIGEDEVWSGDMVDLFSGSGGYLSVQRSLASGDEVKMYVDIHMDELADDRFQGLELTCDLNLLAVQSNMTTVLVIDSAGNPIPGAEVKAYSYGPDTLSLGTTDANGQLIANLPEGWGTTKVLVTYEGMTNNYNQDIRKNSVFIFGTKEVTVQFIDSYGKPITNAYTEIEVMHGAPDPWLAFGKIDESGEATKELLAGTYKFRINYLGRSITFNQNVGDNPVVVFQTGRVNSESNTCTQYGLYGFSNWVPFTNEMELLPGNVCFRFSDTYPATQYAIEAGKENLIH